VELTVASVAEVCTSSDGHRSRTSFQNRWDAESAFWGRYAEANASAIKSYCVSHVALTDQQQRRSLHGS
jgi:hypothetical protein